MDKKPGPRRHTILKLSRPRANDPAICSFCGQPASRDRRLLAGAKAYICSECIKKYGDLVRQGSEPPKP